jgi:hypothetical protein
VKPRAQRILAFLGILLIATIVQWSVGALESGFGGFEDEPAHLVTALMVRDWLANALGLVESSGPSWTEPRAFAESFYIHYPKVAVGQWPPVFHGLLGVWMLVAGTSKFAIVALLTLLTSATAYLVYGAVRNMHGVAAGAVAAAIFLTVPIVQLCGAAAMTEIPLALFSLLAVFAFGRFLEYGNARWIYGFAAASVLTVLTKGSGLALALVPIFCLPLSGRWAILKRPSLWLSGLIVALFTAPWYLATVSLTQGSWGGGTTPSFAYARYAASEYFPWMLGLLGPLGALLVPLGIAVGVRDFRLGLKGGGRWVAFGAWAPALIVLYHVVPSSVEERHLAVLAPAWVALSALGAGGVARWFLRRSQYKRSHAQAVSREQQWAALAIAVMGLSAVVWQGAPPKKDYRGWDQAGQELVAGAENSVRMLVASDPVGEGLFVAGAALADKARPAHYVLRASKVLCFASWSGRAYDQRFANLGELEEWLTGRGVQFLVMDRSVTGTRHWYQHMGQLEALVAEPDSAWVEFSRWDVIRGGEILGGGLIAYRHKDAANLPTDALRLEDVRTSSR